MSQRISRRVFLRGTSVAMALPWLEAMEPAGRFMPAPRPRRLAFLYVPNGMHMPHWTPKEEGSGFELPPLLRPLAAFKDDLFVLSGLTLNGARPWSDGPGDHARAAAAFLTGAHPKKTGGDIFNSVSVDQVSAAVLGRETMFASLEVGCEAGQQSGQCDSGYSCAYSSNISWHSPTMPMTKEIHPRLLFDRMFGAPDEDEEGRRRRMLTRKSILDLVAADSQKLRRQLGSADRRKLDEYRQGVREIEQRMDAADAQRKKRLPGNVKRPGGIPIDYGEHLKLMGDLLVLAFKLDLTRVATFMFANEGSNRSFPDLDVADGHHNLSHHGGDPRKHEQIAAINRFEVEQLAHFLERMSKETEDGHSLLSSSAVVFGSGIGDGNAHNHDELPIVVLGRLRGALRPGRHLRFPKDTPLCNLYLKLLRSVGQEEAQSFGDSTGPLEGLG